MTPPKPYGLDKEQDLRWGCLALVASTAECASPAETIAAAEFFAQYVKGEITVSVATPTAEPETPKGGKVVPIGKRPA